MSWSRSFRDPIVLPDGRILKTLQDAGEYIAALPKKEHDLPEWQTAIEALLLVVEGGPPMFARMAFMKALNRDRPAAPFTRKIKDRPWMSGRRVVTRER